MRVAIGLGTYLGGWRVIRTLGRAWWEIEPPQGLRRRRILGRDHPQFQRRRDGLSTTHVATRLHPGQQRGCPVPRCWQ